jgi:hypothetical protein
MSADMKARLEEIAAMTDKMWATRREMRNASHKETVAENKPETEVKMACQEMEAHQEDEEPTSADRKAETAEQ